MSFRRFIMRHGKWKERKLKGTSSRWTLFVGYWNRHSCECCMCLHSKPWRLCCCFSLRWYSFSAFWIQELLVFIRRFQLHLWAKIFQISGSIQTSYCLSLELLLMWASCRCAEVSTESIWNHKLEEELRWIAQASQASRIAWHDQEEHIRSWSFHALRPLHLSYQPLKPGLISDWPGLTLLDWKESFQEEFGGCYKSALVI